MLDRLKILPVAFVAGLLLLSGPAHAADPAVEAVVREMDKLAAEGKTADVIARAEARVEKADTAPNRYLLGRAYGMAGRFEEAREQFDLALERDISSAYAYHGLGAYHLVKGDLDEAERYLKNAIRLDPKFSRAHMELGKLYLTRQDRLAAQAQFLKVLEYEPDNNDVRVLLAYQYLRDKRWDRAADEFLVVLSKDARNAQAQKGLAVTLAMQKRVDEAIERFKKVIELDPRDLDAYVFLTNLYREKGMKEEAIALLESLLSELPAESPVRTAVEEEIRNIREGRVPRGAAVTVQMLLEQLSSESVAVRREAMMKLVAERLVPPPKQMVGAVKDADPVVRSLAIRNLGDVGGMRVLALFEILVDHPKDREKDVKVRTVLAEAMGRVGDAAGIPVLLLMLGEEDGYVFEAAVRSLRGLTGMSFASDPTKPVPPDDRAGLRGKWQEWWRGPRAFSKKLAAIESIGGLESRRMSRYLLELLADDEAEISKQARIAFGKATGQDIGTEEDTKTKEGRARLVKEAVSVLEKKRPPKKTDGE